MNYYDVLTDDKRYADRWFLDEPRDTSGMELEARDFRYGKPYTGPRPVVVPIQQAGRPVAFNLAAFDMPVVSAQIADILGQLAPGDIQRFPVTVGSGIAGYEIINAVHQRRCVDEVRSGAKIWGPEDDEPDRIGQYHYFEQLVIDPSRTEGSYIFRIWGSVVELIVSDAVKSAIENVPDLGIVFKSVTP